MPTDFVKIEQKSNMAAANYPDQAGPLRLGSNATSKKVASSSRTLRRFSINYEIHRQVVEMLSIPKTMNGLSTLEYSNNAGFIIDI